MAISHASPGQLIDVRPLSNKLAEARTTALFKTDQLEVMRLVVLADKTVPSHQVKGEITVQCLEGELEFVAGEETHLMKAGQLIHLAGGVEHALKALKDSSLLVTIVLQK